MWVAAKLTPLPRTKSQFHITSTNGEKFFVKPGKAFVFKNNSWAAVRSTGLLNNKIDRVIVSPNGSTSLHLPKMTGLLAFHQNHGDAIVLTLPLPKATKLSNGAPSAQDCISPSGDGMIMTLPHNRVADLPYAFGVANRISSDFPAHVKGIAASENGEAIAMASDNQLWIWQQYPEEVKGIGFWTDLTANQRFSIAVESNHPMTQQGRIYHGFMRPRQYFTLHPVLAPNVPQNSAISYQDLVMFDNPDEGRGVCCLTSLLPPCKPFDTLYLFNSICVFEGTKPTFQRADITLPVIEGGGGPCIWWSLDCRLAVIAVSKSLIIVTRFLRVIAVVPLTDIFPGKEPIVSSVAWSCSGQFFLITSTEGKISGVTRSGMPMKHSLCHLTPFSAAPCPLMVTGDSKDPSLFVVYSGDKFRELKVDMSKIPQSLENLMSLHFPQKSVANMWKPAIDAIQKVGCTDAHGLCTLLYFTDLFRIWPYHSPLRWLLWTIFNDGIERCVENQEDLLALLLCRCVFRLTEKPVEVYQKLLYRLGLSTNKRDLIIKKILDDEIAKKDYVVTRSNPSNTRIHFYEPLKEDEDVMLELKMPHHGRNIDVNALIHAVKGILYDPEYEIDDSIHGIDVRILLELMIENGQFEKALALAKHPSVACDVMQLFLKTAALHPEEPGLLFTALQVCVAACPEDEADLRAACVTALVNILKQKIADSMPTASNLKMKFLSNLVSVEETLELVIPENEEQLTDFAVVLGIAFAAADYPNCASYFNGRMNLIPDPLRMPLRDLFGLVWFVRWRFAAICDSAKTGHANDATLRLLAFPEFVNRKAALSQIRAAGEATFSPDAYALYVGGRGLMEKDPAFVDFAVHCSNRITPRALARISSTILNMAGRKSAIPKSNMIVSFVVSHMVPWLRCGIPRALVGFKCNEAVPSELLKFEEFSLPKYRPPKMEIHTTVVTPVEPEVEFVPIVVPEPPKKAKLEPVDDSSSEGEFIPEPISDKHESSDHSFSKHKSTKSKHSKSPKTTKKHRSRHDKSDDLFDREFSRKRTHERETTHQKPRGPALRLLSLDPNARHTYTQHQYPMPQMPQMPQQPHPAPQMRQPPPYTPVWDYDPTKWRKPAPAPSAPVEERPVQIPVEKTPPQKQKPIVIFGSVPNNQKKDDIMDDSSSISDLELEEPQRPQIQNTNPFPLDDGLHKRIEGLLDEAKAAPDPSDLPPPPTFVRPSMKAKPPVAKVSRDPPSEVPPPRTVDSSATVPQSAPTPEWRPRVVTMKGAKIVGVQEITAEQFRQNTAAQKSTRLQEI